MTSSMSAEHWPEVQPAAARRLMLAAAQSFATRGYHATTTRDIASTAGMSPAALYVHFSSKAALLFAISKSGHEQTLALVNDVATTAPKPIDKMRLLVERFVAWHARRHTVAKVVQYEINALPETEYRIVVELRRHIERLVHTMITEGVESGDFTVTDTKTAARAILSLAVDVARWYSERTATDPETLGANYADLVLRMLGAHHERGN